MANIPISSFTAAANATGIGMSGFSLTGANAQSMLDLAGTWNTSGTPTGLKLNVTDTASNAASLLMDLQVGGTSRFSVSKGGYVRGTAGDITNVTYGAQGLNSGFTIVDANTTGIISAGQYALWIARGQPNGAVRMRGLDMFGWTPNNAQDNGDLLIGRDAADTLAQRRGTNAQTFRVYNTFTDASNYERGKMEWASNILRIGTEKAGTGTARDLAFQTDGTTRLTIAATGNVTAESNFYAGTTAQIGWIGRAAITSPINTNDCIALLNNAGNGFGRLQFGGTTASFPALKRNGTALETKLADDSAYAPHSMQYTEITDGVTAPGAAAGRARIYVDTADGDLKVVFADGTVKTIVTDT